VGLWLKDVSGQIFEIVAVDRGLDSVDIQYYDGDIAEFDNDSWQQLELVAVAAPEDWFGSYDIERVDYGVDLDVASGSPPINFLDELDKQH
jgi:hypothetical protein